MSTININNQNYVVDEEVADQFSKFIRRDKAKQVKIAELEVQVDAAIACVHNSHEDDMGYDVLCALGQNP